MGWDYEIFLSGNVASTRYDHGPFTKLAYKMYSNIRKMVYSRFCFGMLLGGSVGTTYDTLNNPISTKDVISSLEGLLSKEK